MMPEPIEPKSPDASANERPESTQPEPTRQPQTSVPDTLISVTLALALAFLFRVYVIEAFVIPTGSMAPTLLGAHYRVRSPDTGAVFAADRRLTETRRGDTISDPITNADLPTAGLTRLDGDRIFVRKRTPLSPIPDRFDVVVFRSPTEPDERVIKRLIGRPGEQVALVDGDVFVRAADATAPGRPTTWHEQGWSIARKPDDVQRVTWQPVHDMGRVREPGNTGPWIAESELWTAGRGAFRFAGDGAGSIRWDGSAWEIRDRSPYNDIDRRRDQRIGSGGVRSGLSPSYPVSDLRVRFGLEPTGDADSVGVVFGVRSHEFRVAVDRRGGTATIRIDRRPDDSDSWIEMASAQSAVSPGVTTEIDIWHADQAITVFAGRELVLRAPYDWTIAQRLANAVPGETLDTLAEFDDGLNRLSDPERYQLPGIRIDVEGETTLHRIRVDRDLHYHPHHAQFRITNNPPPLGTHPITTVSLGAGQLWVLGDNSPASRDGRTWGRPDPWVSHALPRTSADGILPIELLLGDAFLVYFPAMHQDSLVPVPDFGRIRLIE
ncbi:MAG: S26 family signal peptidase [Planctomycetota bacterium]